MNYSNESQLPIGNFPGGEAHQPVSLEGKEMELFKKEITSIRSKIETYLPNGCDVDSYVTDTNNGTKAAIMIQSPTGGLQTQIHPFRKPNGGGTGSINETRQKDIAKQLTATYVYQSIIQTDPDEDKIIAS